MKQKAPGTVLFVAAALLAASAGFLSAQESPVKVSYLYTLSDFKGVFPVSWAKLEVDESKNEIYVVSSPVVKIFNESGMEVYSFNESGELGIISGLAVETSGDMIVLAYQGSRPVLVRCNFRGESISTTELKNLPDEFSGFAPNRMVRHGDSLYFAAADMKVIVTDDKGVFKKGYDIAALMEKDLSEKQKEDIGINGFYVDGEGNILFTNAAMGRAFKMSPDGTISAFGMRGSSAGKFGVPADVATDATGKYVLVADTLRCVVMVFDSSFRFYTEFGFHGKKPGNLIGPMFVAVDNKNKVYVSQLGNRGVNVYQLSLS